MAVLKNIISGVIIGASMLLPGVSGGTTAILLGIYDRLISALSGIFRAPLKNVLFLSEAALGGAVGVLLLAKVMLGLTECFYFPMRYLFMGLILGSVPLLVKSSGITKRKLHALLFAPLGVLAALGIGFIPPAAQGGAGALKLLLCGLLIAVALILPGISTSHLLLSLGMYEQVLDAATRLDIAFLSMLLAGTLMGVFLTARLLEWAMKSFRSECYMLITGFVIASVYSIYPGSPAAWDILFCLLSFSAGFCAMVLLSLKEKNRIDESDSICYY